ncbi:MAG: anti-phage dCTP deaminase [Acidobacteriaceae bacterium]
MPIQDEVGTGQSTSGSELFIGLVAPVGTDHDLLTEILKDSLKSLGYKTEVIRLAQLLHVYPRYNALPENPLDEYIESHQNAGDDFREIIQRADALALLGIGNILETRKRVTGDERKIIPRCAYIIRSLKTPEEVDTLRSVYGDAFVLIGSSATYEHRRRFLADAIARSHHSFQHEQFLPRAETLMLTDQQEAGKPFGQNLLNSYHLADIFVDASETRLLREALERALQLLFGNTFHTPTKDEYGMFLATGAALRSAELGRQVGAAITTDDGSIISLGTNEVPKVGGGQYWAGDNPDFREFVMREDSNDKLKHELLVDLLSRLASDRWLSEDKTRIGAGRLAELAEDPSECPFISGAQLRYLIEFMRAVHAEMSALTDAARRGVATAGATMYVTTFPCHLCAPHIVAAGIKRVVYLEPYAKSLAAQLYPDSVAVGHSDKKEPQLPFEPFVGVAPRKYIDLFKMLKRKRNGSVLDFELANAEQRYSTSPSSYRESETLHVGAIQAAIDKAQLKFEQQEFKYD